MSDIILTNIYITYDICICHNWSLLNYNIYIYIYIYRILFYYGTWYTYVILLLQYCKCQCNIVYLVILFKLLRL